MTVMYSPLISPNFTLTDTEKYITTDPDSEFPLEKGKHYFMDFDISLMPEELKEVTPLESMKWRFIYEMRSRGHDVKNVSVMVPEKDTIRIWFTPVNPVLTIIIVVAIALAIVVGIGGGLFTMFKGFGEGGPVIPIVNIIKENPVAVVAVIAAVGIFLLGVKL